MSWLYSTKRIIINVNLTIKSVDNEWNSINTYVWPYYYDETLEKRVLMAIEEI